MCVSFYRVLQPPASIKTSRSEVASVSYRESFRVCDSEGVTGGFPGISFDLHVEDVRSLCRVMG